MLTGLAQGDGGRVDGFDFAFSKGRLAPNEIIDSCTSPPARYLLEVGRRIIQAAPTADWLVIANPLLPVKARQLAGWVGNRWNGPAVVSDSGQFPLFYIVPRRLFESAARFLLTLSMVDAGLDARLLQGLIGTEVAHRRVPSLTIGDYPLSTATGWFQGRERQKVLRMLAANAIRLVEGNPRWRDLPLAVYHPYHAGSIVFFAAAAQGTAAPLFRRHVICSSYRDIVAACDHRLEPIWLKLPFLPRDNSVGEPQYFSAALDRLGDQVTRENFLVFMRYSRVSGSGPFHLIDHDRFSLGDSLAGTGMTLQEQPPRIARKCGQATAPLKVLFHVTGGLPIKNYPLAYAKTAFRALAALGVRATVIGRPDLEAFGATSIEADETDLLANAVEDHHIFVGLDSFPHHFVRNVMGWPTIGLFGATTSANFGGGWHQHYRSLDASLPCHPCSGEKSCPVFGAKECANYAKPQHLIAAILTMARQVYGYST
jgi:hypothetical protein